MGYVIAGMVAAMSIVIVRHGQTPLNVARVLQTEDTPLSDLGLRQAECLSRRLRELHVTRILCSDYLRARMTIEPFELAYDLRAELHPELRERHFGELRGRSYTELPNVFAADYVPPGGESWSEFSERVASAWHLITRAAAETDGVLAVVTHGLVCFGMLRRHWQLPEHLPGPESFSNASVTVVDRVAPHLVQVVNDVEHLRDL